MKVSLIFKPLQTRQVGGRLEVYSSVYLYELYMGEVRREFETAPWKWLPACRLARQVSAPEYEDFEGLSEYLNKGIHAIVVG